LQPCFDQLKSLDWLADPKTVNAIATNYPQFDAGFFHGTAEEQSEALASILKDAAFHERFGDSSESFREMFKNGGTDHFFRQLTSQAKESQRSLIVSGQVEIVSEKLDRLIAEHLPGEVAALEERNRVLDEWQSGILELLGKPAPVELGTDNVVTLSYHIRNFLNFDPEEMDDIPANAIRSRVPVRLFIEQQFRSWLARRSGGVDVNALGFKNAAHAQRVLSYLVEATDISPIEDFFRENLGYMTSRVDCKQSRRYLAARINNAILLGNGPLLRHRSIEDVRGSLDVLAIAEDKQEFDLGTSPHYLSVILPLLERLNAIKQNATVKGRPSQPGDAELSAIADLP
jgi:hypothetical protein